MADISITPVAPECSESRSAKARVRQPFRFLLEREPATSILRQFSLSDISRYSLSIQASLNAACPDLPRSFSQR